MRAVDTVSTQQRFLIVCEGKQTEPLYFEQFRAPGLIVKVEGTGMNTISLVAEALRLRDEGGYDQVWCVFDKDDFEKFDDAVRLAYNEGMKVAYSNQAFEFGMYYISVLCKMHSKGVLISKC